LIVKKLTVRQKNNKGALVMNQLRLRNESGFTLIELLVVVAIIGILAAIAIPQFAAYRRRGYEATVKTDLRNAATAQEAYFAAEQVYKSGSLTSGNPPGFNKSGAVTSLTATVDTATQTFTIDGTHQNCPGKTWTYTSSSGTISNTQC
jgi:type IV pilus assembly protein PilA